MMTTNTARAERNKIRVSPQKLNLVAKQIRGMTAAKALDVLRFSPKRCASEVYKAVASAVANAENNHGLDVDKLYVAEAWVGRSFVMKRMHTRGRGRSAGIEKPFSNLTIVVREQEGEKKLSSRRARSFSKKTTAGA